MFVGTPRSEYRWIERGFVPWMSLILGVLCPGWNKSSFWGSTTVNACAAFYWSDSSTARNREGLVGIRSRIKSRNHICTITKVWRLFCFYISRIEACVNIHWGEHWLKCCLVRDINSLTEAFQVTLLRGYLGLAFMSFFTNYAHLGVNSSFV